MLDMGFEPQIKKILLDIRPDRQTVMTRYGILYVYVRDMQAINLTCPCRLWKVNPVSVNVAYMGQVDVHVLASFPSISCMLVLGPIRKCTKDEVHVTDRP